ncbi:MAG: hypothetical protein NTY87_12230 [Planctomycetia bacterium]|nr:hypothetical protein [Planctomycetia bacterium]
MSDGFLLSASPGLSGLWPLFILALVTALAAVVNSVAGGGTILTFPVLAAILPAGPTQLITANATSTIGLWPGAILAAWAYRGERTILVDSLAACAQRCWRALWIGASDSGARPLV